MALPGPVRWVLYGILSLVILSILASMLLGFPIGMTYVETGSMEGTIDTGDGYIAVPTALAGPIEVGDVIAFDATNLHDGGIVTHRVVGETSGGYITKGDANPVTDQDGEEPPVTEAQIKAKALTVGGSVVVIPNLGTAIIAANGVVETIQQQLAAILGTRAVLGSQGLAYVLLGFGVVAYLIAALFEGSGDRNPTRRTRRQTGVMNSRTVILGMTVLLVALLTTSMVLPAGTHDFQFVSSESDAEGPSVIEQGTTENVTFNVPSNGPLPVVVVAEPASEGISVNESILFVPGGETRSITVTLDAPPETGVYNRFLTEYRYLAFLPTSAILAMHDVHPWLPIVVLNVLVGGGFSAFAVLLVGLDPIRIGRRQSNVSLRIRLRRWLE